MAGGRDYRKTWPHGTADFAKHDELVEAVAAALDHEARRAFAQGLLHGYRTTEGALAAVRGRIRFDAQVRRRFGLAPPVELRHDDYTADIAGRAPGPDLYQLLAYATAFDLPGGLLIYAGTSRPTAHSVRHAGKRLEVASIDLSGSLPETLACVKQVATRIRRAAGVAGRLARPA